MPLYDTFPENKVTGSPDHPTGHNLIEAALNVLRANLGADLPEHLDGNTLVQLLDTLSGMSVTHDGTFSVGDLLQVKSLSPLVVEPAADVGGGVEAIAESTTTTTIANSSVEAALISQAVADLNTGEMLRLTAVGDYLNNSSSNRSLTFKLRFGSTDVLETNAMNQPSGALRRVWTVDVWIIAESTSGQRVGGFLALPTQTPAALSWMYQVGSNFNFATGYGAGTEDTTTAKTVELRAQHGAAHASLDIRVHAWKLEKVAAA